MEIHELFAKISSTAGTAEKSALMNDNINDTIKQIYEEFYGKPLSEMAEKMLHTFYEDKSMILNLKGDKKMANIKQQKKRILTNEKSRVRNISYKSKVRTAIKAVRVAVEKKDLELANTKLVLAFSVIDRSVSKGIQKKGTADRQKSNIQNLVNSLKK